MIKKCEHDMKRWQWETSKRNSQSGEETEQAEIRSEKREMERRGNSWWWPHVNLERKTDMVGLVFVLNSINVDLRFYDNIVMRYVVVVSINLSRIFCHIKFFKTTLNLKYKYIYFNFAGEYLSFNLHIVLFHWKR